MPEKKLEELRNKCILQAKDMIKKSIGADMLAVQTISSIEELEEIENKLITRLREWYSLYNPEFSRSISNNKKFAELVIKKDKKTLLNEIGVNKSMGADFSRNDVEAIRHLAKCTVEIIHSRDEKKVYLEKLLERHCNNLKQVLGTILSAKILRHAGCLKNVAFTPAPVIQIMGAEKSLFKHMKNKAKSPKYGMIFEHPLMAKVKGKNKGKMARAIADNAVMAAKTDFFKGKPRGEELRQELELKAEMLR